MTKCSWELLALTSDTQNRSASPNRQSATNPMRCSRHWIARQCDLEWAPSAIYRWLSHLLRASEGSTECFSRLAFGALISSRSALRLDRNNFAWETSHDRCQTCSNMDTNRLVRLHRTKHPRSRSGCTFRHGKWSANANRMWICTLRSTECRGWHRMFPVVPSRRTDKFVVLLMAAWPFYYPVEGRELKTVSNSITNNVYDFLQTRKHRRHFAEKRFRFDHRIAVQTDFTKQNTFQSFQIPNERNLKANNTKRVSQNC